METVKCDGQRVVCLKWSFAELKAFEASPQEDTATAAWTPHVGEGCSGAAGPTGTRLKPRESWKGLGIHGAPLQVNSRNPQAPGPFAAPPPPILWSRRNLPRAAGDGAREGGRGRCSNRGNRFPSLQAAGRVRGAESGGGGEGGREEGEGSGRPGRRGTRGEGLNLERSRPRKGVNEERREGRAAGPREPSVRRRAGSAAESSRDKGPEAGGGGGRRGGEQGRGGGGEGAGEGCAQPGPGAGAPNPAEPVPSALPSS